VPPGRFRPAAIWAAILPLALENDEMSADWIKFIEENPSDPRVVRILKLADQPLTPEGKLGRLIGELARDVDARAGKA
jgi:hypothetical protein